MMDGGTFPHLPPEFTSVGDGALALQRLLDDRTPARPRQSSEFPWASRRDCQRAMLRAALMQMEPALRPFLVAYDEANRPSTDPADVTVAVDDMRCAVSDLGDILDPPRDEDDDERQRADDAHTDLVMRGLFAAMGPASIGSGRL